MSEENQLFRKKSMDSISAPEEINEYIRVVGINVWIILAAVVILLLGVLVWARFGRLETCEKTRAVVSNGAAVCYLSADIAKEVTTENVIKIGDKQADVVYISDEPVTAGSVYSEKDLAELGLDPKEIVYGISSEINLADGTYNAEIVVESIHPMEFVTN